MQQVRIHVQIPLSLKKAIEAKALQDDRTFSAQVRVILEKYLKG